MKTVLAIPLLAVLAAACTDTPANGRYGPASLDHSKLPVERVKGRTLYDADLLGFPSDIARVGRYLTVLDGAADSVVHVLRAEDGSYVRSLGRRGAGPREFKGAWTLGDSEGDELWVYDLSVRRMTRIDLGVPVERAGEPLPMRSFNLVSSLTPTDPRWCGDTVLVSPGFFVDGRIARFNPAGELVRTVGAVPEDGSGMPPTVRQEAYVGRLAVDPAGRRLAIATRHADRIEIYRCDGTLLGRVRGPFGFDPVYGTARGRNGPIMSTGDDLRFGYVDVAATGKYIFALFSGRTREGYKGDSSFGRFVHVFSWDGRLLRVVEADSDLLAITVDPAANTLYAIRHAPSPAVLAFPLRGVLD